LGDNEFRQGEMKVSAMKTGKAWAIMNFTLVKEKSPLKRAEWLKKRAY